MITITLTNGTVSHFRGYSIRNNAGKGQWLWSLRPISFTSYKERALVFPTVEASHAAQECCRLNGYYTTASLRK